MSLDIGHQPAVAAASAEQRHKHNAMSNKGPRSHIPQTNATGLKFVHVTEKCAICLE